MIAAGTAISLLLAAAVIGVIVAMPDRGGEDVARSPTVASAEPSVTAPPTEAGAGGGASHEQTSPPAKPVLEDGRHAVFLTDVDTVGRSVEFDLIQFLTGDAAVSAYHKDYPDQRGGPPNNYYIINDNPKLRRLPVADDVAVTVLDWTAGLQQKTVAFADLPARGIPGNATTANPFWLTVVDGTVIAIEEQYLP